MPLDRERFVVVHRVQLCQTVASGVVFGTWHSVEILEYLGHPVSLLRIDSSCDFVNLMIFCGLLYWKLEQLNAELNKRKVKVSGN